MDNERCHEARNGRQGASVHGIILAAGRSVRMGSDKALLDWEGRTFVQHAAGLLAQVGTVSVVTRGDLAVRLTSILPGIAVLVNPDPAPGLFSSVLIGLAAVPAGVSRVFIHPVDCPLDSAHALERLLEAAEGRLSNTILPVDEVFVPVFDGTRGHPVLLTPGAIRALRQRPPSAVFSEELENLAPVEVRVDCDDILRNINTLSELVRLTGRSGGEGGRQS